ncbi:MAG: sensor histidine kinase, partial [Novibacillus thermophilus]
MLEQINTLIKENYEKQLIIKETEYRALQSQINPHFLYNTLNSVTWMAKVNKQEQIASVVESLGNMMRSIVSKKEPLIQIGEELQIVKDYVNIQRVRYKERLQFCLEVDPGLEQFFIPKLTIQPIVENAILHGVGAVTKGKVSVSVLSRQKDIFVVVEDDGPGMNEATVQDIFAGKVKSKGTGIGLKNIHDRLQLIFGERYGIEVESELENGTKVMFNIPYEKR